MVDTIVFLGPTLPLQAAKEIFPEACFHAPAKCGDIFRILRLKPKKIVLIDGLFENVLSIWHKEILFAIERGVIVYGASSMGAIRAAELAAFGMIGIGKIFQDFSTSVIDNDDAVAVLHADKEAGYRPTNEALVDFQATLEAALANGVIALEQKKDIFTEISSWFYPERTISKLAKKAQENPSLFQSFYSWVDSKGLIHRKRNDAIEALQYARSDCREIKKGREVAKTRYFRHLMLKINLSVYPENYDYLPSEEKDLVILERTNPKLFQALVEVGFLLSLCADLAQIDPLYTRLNGEDLSETAYDWALSRSINIADREKWARFFSEALDCEATSVLHSLLFLAVDGFPVAFPEDYDDLALLEEELSQQLDMQKMRRVAKKMKSEEMIARVLRFHGIYDRRRVLWSMKSYGFEPTNWLISANHLVKTIPNYRIHTLVDHC